MRPPQLTRFRIVVTITIILIDTKQGVVDRISSSHSSSIDAAPCQTCIESCKSTVGRGSDRQTDHYAYNNRASSLKSSPSLCLSLSLSLSFSALCCNARHCNNCNKSSEESKAQQAIITVPLLQNRRDRSTGPKNNAIITSRVEQISNNNNNKNNAKTLL